MLPTTVAAVAVVYALLMVATGVVCSAVAECGGIGGGGAPAMGEAGREDGREAVREADFEAGRDAGRKTRCEEAWEWAWEGDVGWDVARRRMRSWPELSDTMLVTGAARAANVPEAGGAAVSQLKPSPRLPPASPPPKRSLCFSNHRRRARRSSRSPRRHRGRAQAQTRARGAPRRHGERPEAPHTRPYPRRRTCSRA